MIQHRADSIRAVMESKEDQLAALQDRTAFTIKAAGLINQGRLLRDIELLNLEYGEVFAQLELAKFDLRNKTPLVSVVDSPRYSTIKERADHAVHDHRFCTGYSYFQYSSGDPEVHP